MIVPSPPVGLRSRLSLFSGKSNSEIGGLFLCVRRGVCQGRGAWTHRLPECRQGCFSSFLSKWVKEDVGQRSPTRPRHGRKTGVRKRRVCCDHAGMTADFSVIQPNFYPKGQLPVSKLPGQSPDRNSDEKHLGGHCGPSGIDASRIGSLRGQV